MGDGCNSAMDGGMVAQLQWARVAAMGDGGCQMATAAAQSLRATTMVAQWTTRQWCNHDCGCHEWLRQQWEMAMAAARPWWDNSNGGSGKMDGSKTSQCRCAALLLRQMVVVVIGNGREAATWWKMVIAMWLWWAMAVEAQWTVGQQQDHDGDGQRQRDCNAIGDGHFAASSSLWNTSILLWQGRVAGCWQQQHERRLLATAPDDGT
jgi:hypothetical protein